MKKGLPIFYRANLNLRFYNRVEFTHEAPPATGIASFRSTTIHNINYDSRKIKGFRTIIFYIAQSSPGFPGSPFPLRVEHG